MASIDDTAWQHRAASCALQSQHTSGKDQRKVIVAAVLSKHFPGLTTCAGMQTDMTARIARRISPL